MTDETFTRVATSDGGSLAVRRAGQPGARAIVFVHGYSLSSAVWVRQLASSALAGYDLVAPDLRGCGASVPGTASMDEPATWADDLAAVLDALALDRPVIVAWSYGGVVLGDFLAGGGSRRLSGLMLMAAAPLIDRPLGPSDDPFFGLIPALLGDDAAARTAAEHRFVRLLTREHLDASTTRELEAAVAAVPSGVRKAMIDRVINHLGDYAALTLPVLVAHGDSDALLPPAVSDVLMTAIPGAELLRFAGLGHAPFLEAPAAFDAALDAFVGRLS
jgi:non-heme chloroperoxidase